jgi:TRAP-type C4-dicarboxylate transport system permease small subunit
LSHLLLFILFLIFSSWIIISKDSKNYIGYTKISIVLIAGLITIFFNLLFNNHNSFKESWKLLTKKSREKLMEKEREKFNG